MQETISIEIIHASGLIRDGIKDLLSRQPDVRVAGAFDSARDVLERPVGGDHILLYDLGTSHQDGPALMAELRNRLPQAKILVFGVADDDAAIIECIRAGASGCILQNASLDDLLEAIRSLAHGTPPISPRVLTTLFSYVARLQAGDDRPPPSPLTPREEQILQLIAEGLTNKEIAQQLYLQPQTVKNYVHLILQKLNLRSRFEVIRSLRAGKR
jgi:DNA-binding NarL/FixJ family response regulator